jgi:hypothetical protein
VIGSGHVTPNTPSTFIYSTSDDAQVPVEASVEFYSALLRVGTPAEMHLFRHGAHGSGLGRGDASLLFMGKPARGMVACSGLPHV